MFPITIPKTFIAISPSLCQIGFVSNNVMRMASPKLYDLEPSEAFGRP